MGPKELNAKLEAAAASLPGVERKRMPGGYALFAAGKIFANVTLDARIGLKLPVAWCLEELASLPGATPWKLGQKVMEGWVLVPESFHHNDAALSDWLQRAHGCATGQVPLKRPEISDPPPTARSVTGSPPPAPQKKNGVFGSIPPAPRSSAIIFDDVDDGASSPPKPPASSSKSVFPRPAIPVPIPRSRASRSLVPAPPSSRSGYDFSHYSAPPPSTLGIRVVPPNSKSPFEETLIGVPAPSSSTVELENPNGEREGGDDPESSSK